MKWLAAFALLIAVAGCNKPPPAAPSHTAVTRSLGTFQGRGSQTIGVVSDSGRLRVSWQTKSVRAAGSGNFHLALHSAVSGRPLQVIVDTRGEGSGSADIAEDPRPFNFMVDSENLDWTITVDEIIAVPATP